EGRPDRPLRRAAARRGRRGVGAGGAARGGDRGDAGGGRGGADRTLAGSGSRLRRRAGSRRPAPKGLLMPETTYLEAAIRALTEGMQRDPAVWAVGEDLGRGGVFGQYRGLAERFGPERICDAPISEAAILGAAVGAALNGTRPVVEMRFSD